MPPAAAPTNTSQRCAAGETVWPLAQAFLVRLVWRPAARPLDPIGQLGFGVADRPDEVVAFEMRLGEEGAFEMRLDEEGGRNRSTLPNRQKSPGQWLRIDALLAAAG
jgi:hypothetical protein